MGDTAKIFDGLLVLQCQSGNKKALTLLVERYHAKLYRQAYWYVSDSEAAKDIVQDSWSIIMAKLGKLKNPNSFGSWATKIVIRKSLDHLNENTRNRRKREAYAARPMNDGPKEVDIALKKRLLNAIAALPYNQQEVLRLFYTQEYSLQEISDILGVSTGTVKSRLFHAREKLKTILKKKNHE